jgi:Histidine phosphatase superfamily (branch 1)
MEESQWLRHSIVSIANESSLASRKRSVHPAVARTAKFCRKSALRMPQVGRDPQPPQSSEAATLEAGAMLKERTRRYSIEIKNVATDARAAQARIVGAIDGILEAAPSVNMAVIAHGGVGALLLCQLKGAPISRAEDQPGEGGGNFFVFRRDDRTLLQGWRPIDAAPT